MSVDCLPWFFLIPAIVVATLFFATAVDFRVRTMAASWDPWILGSLAPGRLAGVVRLGALSTFYFNSALVAHFLTIPGQRLFGKGLSEPWQSWALISFSEVAFSGCFLATSLREKWQVATVLSTQVECGTFAWLEKRFKKLAKSWICRKL